MARTKTTTPVETEVEEPVAGAEAEELPPETPDAPEAPESPDAAPGGVRKPLGTKEVIPFKWKLVGRGGDLIVTLFKSVEQEDAQAQFERLGREGYYTNLQILDVNAKVEQPKPTKPVHKPKPVKEPEKPSKSVKTKEAPAKGKPTKEKPTAVAVKSSPKKKTMPAKVSKPAAKKSASKKK